MELRNKSVNHIMITAESIAAMLKATCFVLTSILGDREDEPWPQAKPNSEIYRMLETTLIGGQTLHSWN